MAPGSKGQAPGDWRNPGCVFQILACSAKSPGGPSGPEEPGGSTGRPRGQAPRAGPAGRPRGQGLHPGPGGELGAKPAARCTCSPASSAPARRFAESSLHRALLSGARALRSSAKLCEALLPSASLQRAQLKLGQLDEPVLPPADVGDVLHRLRKGAQAPSRAERLDPNVASTAPGRPGGVPDLTT